MKHGTIRKLAAAAAVAAGLVQMAAGAADLDALAREDYAHAVRPGGVDGSPFWNQYSRMFMYPPAFDFSKGGPGTVKYRFTVFDAAGKTHVFDAPSSQSPLTPVWNDVAPGQAWVYVSAVDKDGKVHGIPDWPRDRFSRTFWRSAPFRPGAYPPAPRSYAEAVAKCGDEIFERPATQYFLKTGKPDPDYKHNCYPAKMHSALIIGMLDYATRRPDRADDALKLARNAADFLISISQPQGAPLEYWPPTYADKREAGSFRYGQNMLIYPCNVGTAYLALYDRVKDAKYLEAAKRIADTYVRLQEADGTWPIFIRESDGKVLNENRVQPTGIITFLERLYRACGDEKYRACGDRAFAWVEAHPLKDWFWEGQFEDSPLVQKYENPSKHPACELALYLLERYPGDKKRLAVARDILRYAEDQFVCWEKPCAANGHGVNTPTGVPSIQQNRYDDWFYPCVLEQYVYYVPIDASNAKLIKTYLALYRAEKNPLDLAKARALGDSLVRIQRPSGYIPTEYALVEKRDDPMQGWLNCTCAALSALAELAEFSETELPREHVFSMSFKVTALNGELRDAAVRRTTADWLRTNGFSRVWLESYRHAERVPDERLAEMRDFFAAEGFGTAGLITPTCLNDPAKEGEKPPIGVCWSDPVARARLAEESARAARLFNTVLLDDFLFACCGDGCPRCRAAKEKAGEADWGRFRRALMLDVCRESILAPARKAKPTVQFIIKFPCWYRYWEDRGYSPFAESELFGASWVGTETRDANPDPLQACWIVGHLQRLSGGRCLGGWYDALDSTPEKFLEQARYTILGGARESLVHCYDYLLAQDPGITPFGEKAGCPRECADIFAANSASLRNLAALVADAESLGFRMLPSGVSEHRFRRGSREFKVLVNTRDEAVEGVSPHGMRIDDCSAGCDGAGVAEIVVCDQLGQTIDIYDAAGSNVWRWTAADDRGIPDKFKAAFAGNVAEAKSADGGKKILMVACGGCWAVIDRATCMAEAWGTNAGWSHSIELVGKDVVAVVSTGGGNLLFLFDISGEAAMKPELQKQSALAFDEPHGLHYDGKWLWLVDTPGLHRCALSRGKDGEPVAAVDKSWPFVSLGVADGHDLRPVPGTSLLALTTNGKILFFDMATEKWREDLFIERVGVKGFDPSPDGKSFLVTTAKTKWWTDSLELCKPGEKDGKTTFTPFRTIPGARIYKARWVK